MNMQAVVSKGRSVPVVSRHPRKRVLSARDAAESLFRKREAVSAKPRILEAANDAPATPPASTAVSTAVETPHQKVFRLVGERKFEEAARLAARLINAQDFDGFLIYGHTADFRRSRTWFDDMVNTSKRSVARVTHQITPATAQIIIAHNDGNRRMNAQNLAGIMRDISDDRWMLNGASIAVSKDGRTNDGQHRAFGVLLTGESIRSGFTFGLMRQSMATEDIGRKRTGSDRLAISGAPNATRVAAISTLAFEMYHGRSATAAEAQDYYFDNEDRIVRAHAVAGNPQRGLGNAAPGVAAFHLLGLGADEESIRLFFTSLRTGEMLKRRNPIYTLREALREKTVQWTRHQWVRGLVHHYIVWSRGKTLATPTSPDMIAEAI